ncbi:hypothetical protein CICLE_v10010863mg [Citrus x clementina]|uniref:Uncharacterized protein n=1 Tax=Citrus clementina TaxID=85681 RepID=V4TL64_CITCL|nr:hypothetical protein CICLE_v10010863mg [Citrus x clementina]
MHLHTSKLQAEAHHQHQASQDPQVLHQDLSSIVLLPCLFVFMKTDFLVFCSHLQENPIQKNEVSSNKWTIIH